MQNRNISSQVAIRTVQQIEQSHRTRQMLFRGAVDINDVLLQVCLDPKYHFLLRSGFLDGCLYPYLYPIFCDSRKWLESNQPGAITHIKVKGGFFYIIINFKYVICVKYCMILDALTVWNPIRLQYCIEPKGQCTCLAPYKKGVLVVVKFPSQFHASSPQIQRYNSYGDQEKTIVFNSDNGEALFKNPQDIAVDDDRIIVSDGGKQSVIVFNEDGKLLQNFVHKEMLNPRSLCVDQFSNIYVASDRKVLQVKSDYSESRVLISSTTDQNRDLTYLFFCKETNLLSVAYEGKGASDIVKYQFMNSDEKSFKKEIQHQNSLQNKCSAVSLLSLSGACIIVFVCMVRSLKYMKTSENVLSFPNN